MQHGQHGYQECKETQSPYTTASAFQAQRQVKSSERDERGGQVCRTDFYLPFQRNMCSMK